MIKYFGNSELFHDYKMTSLSTYKFFNQNALFISLFYTKRNPTGTTPCTWRPRVTLSRTRPTWLSTSTRRRQRCLVKRCLLTKPMPGDKRTRKAGNAGKSALRPRGRNSSHSLLKKTKLTRNKFFLSLNFFFSYIINLVNLTIKTVSCW